MKRLLHTFAAAVVIALVGNSHAATILTVDNPGFEDGLVGWTFNNFTITNSANSGSNAIQAGSQPIATASQSINIDAFAVEIDAGLSTIDIDYFVSGQDNFDFYTVSIEFYDGLDGSGSSLGSASTVGPTAGTGGFVADTIDGGAAAVPVGARSFILTLEGNIGSAGSSIGIAYDDVSASINVDAEPGSPVALAGFSYDATSGDSEVSIEGAASTAYILVEADDLDFANPNQNPVPLTAATVGTLAGNQVTTDTNGNATVQFNLGTAKDATFLRAETAP